MPTAQSVGCLLPNSNHWLLLKHLPRNNWTKSLSWGTSFTAADHSIRSRGFTSLFSLRSLAIVSVTHLFFWSIRWWASQSTRIFHPCQPFNSTAVQQPLLFVQRWLLATGSCVSFSLSNKKSPQLYSKQASGLLKHHCFCFHSPNCCTKSFSFTNDHVITFLLFLPRTLVVLLFSFLQHSVFHHKDLITVVD